MDLRVRFDESLGRLAERRIIRHHRRRLQRAGWDDILKDVPGSPAGETGASPPPRAGEGQGGGIWAADDPPARPGNQVDILVDGAAAFEAIAEDLRRAGSHVHISGWNITPRFALTRDDQPVVLRDLLNELTTRVPVRVLMWGGAPLPLFRPSRREAEQVQRELSHGSRLRCVLDTRERPMHCHHEKTVIVDDRVAFVGGIDLTNFDHDRWDTPDHATYEDGGWHDVAARVRGPAVADVAAHFRLRWHAITGEALPQTAPSPLANPLSPPPPAAEGEGGGVTAQIIATIPDHMYAQRPQGSFRILDTYLRALRAAERLVYLENQFLWSPEIVAVLREKLTHPPTPDFRVLLVLPQKPSSGGDDTRGQLSTLIEADAGRGRILATTLYGGRGPRPAPVYVHAKVGIVDDRWLTIGSANLNEHSLFNDTELNLVINDPGLPRATRLRLWSEHLRRPATEIAGDPTRVIDELWIPIARRQARLVAQHLPPTERIVELTHGSRRAGLILGPVQGLIVDA